MVTEVFVEEPWLHRVNEVDHNLWGGGRSMFNYALVVELGGVVFVINVMGPPSLLVYSSFKQCKILYMNTNSATISKSSIHQLKKKLEQHDFLSTDNHYFIDLGSNFV